MRRGERGGILLDAFLIVALLCGGGYLYFSWKRGRTAGVLEALLAPAPAPAPVSSEPDIDISEKSALLQADARDLLARHGVGEKHVLKSYNQQRLDDGVQWLEATLELRSPGGLRKADFLRDLAAVLEKDRAVLVADRNEPGRWILELGDRKRVYQRIVFL